MRAMATRPRLFLIDGYSNIFRAFYAMRELSSSKGEPTNAVYIFVNMLRKLLREEKPEYIGVAMDLGEPTIRGQRYEAYKATRAPMPEDLVPQIPRVRQVLAAYRIPALEFPGYEADDVIGTVAKRAEEAGFDVVLVSADKDFLQLVGGSVRLFHTFRNKLYDPALVEADLGVPPSQVIDLMALLGDSIDNVPGVPGIGEKGAPALIRQYGSLENLLDHAGELTNKRYREGLLNHREQALLSKELVTIHCDLPVPFEPEKLRRQEPDNRALEELFGELEFFSLRDELVATDVKSAEAPEIRELETPAELAAELARLAGGPEWVVAVLGPERPVAIALGLPGEPGVLVDFRRGGLREPVVDALCRRLAMPTAAVWGHDLKELLRLLGSRRERPRARLFDAMLLSYLIKPSQHSHRLEEIALERLRVRAMDSREAGFDKGSEPMTGADGLRRLAAERLSLVGQLVPAMRSEMAGRPLEQVYTTMEEPLLGVLVAMEEAGIELDCAFLGAMATEMGAELGELERNIYDIAGETFNIDSPQQLGTILFEKLAYPGAKRTAKTKSYSTAADVLEGLAEQGYPLPERLLRYRELSKLKSTYVDSLPSQVDARGRLHTRYEQAVAATGRLSSVNPNLQNIPVRSEAGRRIRRAFRAPAGKLLLVADYNQIELRVLAHIAGEEALVESFRAGLDIHRVTAAKVLGLAPELVNAEQRRAAKVINFGILYGMSPFGLAKTLGISTKDADGFIQAYLAQYPKVRAYMEDTLRAAEASGRVETLFGRLRWLPDITSKNRNLRENARRMAINARIQGTAADLLKLAMIAVADRLADWPGAQLLLTVHDELVLEAPAEQATALGEVVRAAMQGVAELAVPLVADVGVGPTWYDAKS
jgi:DNA polymerase-1